MTAFSDFSSRQLRYALTAIQRRMDVVTIQTDNNIIIAGECEEWEALVLFKVQLLMALERSEKVDKTWSN